MSKPISPVEKFFRRYSLVTFVLLAGLMLAAVSYVCFNTYVDATTPTDELVESSVPSSFDTQTAERIEQLHESDQAPELTFPNEPGRINPFVE